MINRNMFGALLATSVAGILATSAAVADGAAKKDAKDKAPYCKNSCKGKSACAGHGNAACSGKNTCKGKGWIEASDATDCKTKGGVWSDSKAK